MKDFTQTQRATGAKEITMKHLAITVLFFGLINTVQAQSTPSLNDTTDWIHSFTEVHGTASGTSLDNSWWSEVDHAVFRGCQATVSWTFKSSWTEEQTDSVEFNLKDIEPRIAVENEHFVILRTRNDQRIIRSGTHPSRSLSTAFEMRADSEDAARRLVNALQHAVLICGGKPSTF